MIEAFPLQWPAGWPRSEPAKRSRAKFLGSSWVGIPGSADNRRVFRELTIAEGRDRVVVELGRLGVSSRRDIVISTNMRVRIDGELIAKQANPADVGVAVYWTDPATEVSRCMAIDIYDRVADNLGAVAATIEAMRAIERHGGAQILARAFTGFTALPAPGAPRGWREVLGLAAGYLPQRDTIEQAYRLARSKAHPDKGGTPGAFVEVERAYEEACKLATLRSGP